LAVGAGRAFAVNGGVDRAAALTYFGVLAIFPGLIVVVALGGLAVGTEASIETVMDLAHRIAPGGTLDGIEPAVRNLATARSTSAVLLPVGLIGAVWTASGYVRAYTRAANAAYQVREDRPFVRLRVRQLALTTAALIVLGLTLVAIVLSGPIARAVGETLRIGEVPLRIWAIAKWPLLVLLAWSLLSMLGAYGPNVRGRRPVRVGSAVTLALAAPASALLGVYIAQFGSYNRVYGSLGAVIAFLVWLFLLNCAVVYGVEFTVAVARGRNGVTIGA
jgi:membrane protein